MVRTLHLTWRLLRFKTNQHHAQTIAAGILEGVHLTPKTFALANDAYHATFRARITDDPVLADLVERIVAWFTRSGGPNSLELRFVHTTTGPLTLTVQRHHGATPAEQRDAVIAERDTFAHQVDQLRTALEWLNNYSSERDLGEEGWQRVQDALASLEMKSVQGEEEEQHDEGNV